MVYNDKKVEQIGEKIASISKTEIKDIDFKNGNSRIKLEDGKSISVSSHHDNVELISIYGRNKGVLTSHEITLHRHALIRKTHPFYIVSREEGITDDGLAYDKLSCLSLFSQNYYYIGQLNNERYASFSAPVVAHLSLESKRNNAGYKAKYSERYKTEGLFAYPRGKGKLDVSLTLKGEEKLAELTRFIRELKKQYKGRECEIYDILKCILMQDDMDSFMKDNFEQLVDMNGAKQKMKRR